MRKDLIVLTFAAVLLSTTPLFAAELDLAPEPALCPVSPTEGALAMAACKDCPPTQFSPRFGVVCSFTGSCQHGAAACCESTCTCGVSDGLPGTPANACALTLPCGCCLTAGGCRGLCTIGYCNGPGERCVPIGCGFGCCIFGCGHADPTCTGIDPIPPEACSFP